VASCSELNVTSACRQSGERQTRGEKRVRSRAHQSAWSGRHGQRNLPRRRIARLIARGQTSEIAGKYAVPRARQRRRKIGGL